LSVTDSLHSSSPRKPQNPDYKTWDGARIAVQSLGIVASSFLRNSSLIGFSLVDQNVLAKP
jgi:hypothetical protein